MERSRRKHVRNTRQHSSHDRSQYTLKIDQRMCEAQTGLMHMSLICDSDAYCARQTLIGDLGNSPYICVDIIYNYQRGIDIGDRDLD